MILRNTRNFSLLWENLLLQSQLSWVLMMGLEQLLLSSTYVTRRRCGQSEIRSTKKKLAWPEWQQYGPRRMQKSPDCRQKNERRKQLGILLKVARMRGEGLGEVELVNRRMCRDRKDLFNWQRTQKGTARHLLQRGQGFRLILPDCQVHLLCQWTPTGAAGEDSEDVDEGGEHDLMAFTDQVLEGEQNVWAVYLKSLMLTGTMSSLLPHLEIVESQGLWVLCAQ
jgi:hypothetical protein